MANLKVSSSRSSDITDKQSVFPPRCPFPASSSSWGDERPKSGLDSRCEQTRHRHTLSESFHIDEQPPWLDDLLNESETPVKRSAHRRSFSDSSPILGGSNFHSNITNLYVEEGSQKGYTSSSLWGLNEINNLRDGKSWEYTNYTSEHDNNAIAHNIKREDQKELVQEANCSSEMKDDSTTKRLENDSKSDKKQFARHSRIRKLQYIAELEMIAQSLQISAELEFLDRQNLILNLENRSLRQRLDNLSHQRLIKHVQHEMLEQEAAHLRTLYQQQQLQQQPTPAHTRSRSKDLDSQLASLSLNHKDMPSRI
ncbi:hypothetical protein ZIOFF_033541 [Zingiber officinale]|uniref:Uncharacterized protein n=1 Tax=Zingiber officinale TaxID=94328 RepID=A0A8J5GQT5_ZINOF|nr:hypothetical protein ZIOFF_033541 [Zingiber officinale]